MSKQPHQLKLANQVLRFTLAPAATKADRCLPTAVAGNLAAWATSPKACAASVAHIGELAHKKQGRRRRGGPGGAIGVRVSELSKGTGFNVRVAR
jgi:hypothetical protein